MGEDQIILNKKMNLAKKKANLKNGDSINVSKVPKIESSGSMIDEDVFFEVLKRKKEIVTHQPKYPIFKIYNKMRIFSADKLSISEVKYYKFPFSTCIRNDGTSLFKLIYIEWTKAARGAYDNFRKSGKSFAIKFQKGLVFFDVKTRLTECAKSSLDKNEIHSEEKDGWLYVDASDVNLVFDFIINSPMCLNFEVPFIISNYEFENSISYHTKVRKKPTAKFKNTVKYHYEIEGYFVGGDYSYLFKYDIKLDDT